MRTLHIKIWERPVAPELMPFSSDDVTLVGSMFRPPTKHTGSMPCIILCTGFSGTQDKHYKHARLFAQHGFLAFTFDMRTFGLSQGEPRQVISIREQLRDLRAAIDFVLTLPEVDASRVGLWGTSLGGGHVVRAAADDPRVAAVVSQVPFNGFPKKVEGRSRRETRALSFAILRDWLAGRTGSPPRYIKATGQPGELAVMATGEAEAALAVSEPSELWRNEVAPRVLLDMALWYRPGKHAHRIQVPVLVCVAERDRESPVAKVVKIAREAPLGELRRYPCTHFAFYHASIYPHITADQASFFKTHLGMFGAG